MEKIVVYEGKGAVLADDVKKALKTLSYHCRGIREVSQLGNAYEEAVKVFIVPGGFTREIGEGWGKEGREAIRRFVTRGGTYIGICAGVYLAAPVVEVKGRPPGLGLLPVENRRSSGLEIRTIRLTAPDDPLALGCPEEIKIWYQNGPLIKGGENCRTVAVYEDGSGALVRGRFGKGKVILFSAHPEGSREFGVNGQKLGSLQLLKNGLKWALSGSGD